LKLATPPLYLAVDELEDVERDDVEAVVDGADDVLDSALDVVDSGVEWARALLGVHVCRVRQRQRQCCRLRHETRDTAASPPPSPPRRHLLLSKSDKRHEKPRQTPLQTRPNRIENTSKGVCVGTTSE